MRFHNGSIVFNTAYLLICIMNLAYVCIFILAYAHMEAGEHMVRGAQHDFTVLTTVVVCLSAETTVPLLYALIGCWALNNHTMRLLFRHSYRSVHPLIRRDLSQSVGHVVLLHEHSLKSSHLCC